ncbi:uncharacterized [Tachysurus ichikawai]
MTSSLSLKPTLICTGLNLTMFHNVLLAADKREMLEIETGAAEIGMSQYDVDKGWNRHWNIDTKHDPGRPAGPWKLFPTTDPVIL